MEAQETLNSVAKNIFNDKELWNYQIDHINNTKPKYYAALRAINYNKSIRAIYYTTTDIKACIEKLVNEYGWSYIELSEITGVSLNCIQNWAGAKHIRFFKRSSNDAIAIIDHLNQNFIQSPESIS